MELISWTEPIVERFLLFLVRASMLAPPVCVAPWNTKYIGSFYTVCLTPAVAVPTLHRYFSKLSRFSRSTVFLSTFPFIDGARKLHEQPILALSIIEKAEWNTVERENRDSAGTVTV